MDTLSRDSSSSSNNILPMVAIAIGGIGLLIGVFGMVKATKLEKIVATQGEELLKIETVRGEVQALGTKVDTDIRALSSSVNNVLSQVGSEMGVIKGQITKIEEQLKKPAPVAAAAKGGGAAVATGTLDANGNYTVGPGDTISKIAKKFATKVDSIEAENPGLNPAKLRVGQKIKIPKK
jgi:LysM repeat protein